MKENVSIVLDDDQALVLFETLSRWSEAGDHPREIEHPAEDEVLLGMLAALESQMTAPLESDYCDRLSAAREKLAPSGG